MVRMLGGLLVQMWLDKTKEKVLDEQLLGLSMEIWKAFEKEKMLDVL